jgi:hypothetical protein
MSAMTLSRRQLLCATLGSIGAAVEKGFGQEGPVAKLGVLLDTSSEMGFLVPQVRKELRILNEQLAAAGRPQVVLREIVGADLDREASTSVGARRNVLYGLKALYVEVDTVIWITSLQGQQSPEGIFAVEQLLLESIPDRPARQLLLRNIWQDQLIAGNDWVPRPPAPNADPLDPRNRPAEWFRLVEEKRGVIQRSWQVPPANSRGQFAFPYRVADYHYLKKLEYEAKEAFFDQSWVIDLNKRHNLQFVREKEEWPARITGRRWLMEATMLPFADQAGLTARNQVVFEALANRESIGEDLDRIEATKLGVIFALGYVSLDLKRHLADRDKPPRSWREYYMADLTRLGGECARATTEGARHANRLYATERMEHSSKSVKPEGADPISRRVAKMAREEKCDAIYLFTNGYLGQGDYGTWTLDWNLLALAIREAGARLYVRVPFEFGPTPIALASLAMASGGGVFRGRGGDPDWEMELPKPSWPEPAPPQD